MNLFDAHCHLQDARLRADLPGVMTRARAAGVEHMLCCGTAEDDWAEVARLAEEYPAVVPAFGLHPWYAQRRSPAWMERLRALLAGQATAAVGEIGLDHAIEERNDAEQEAVFLAQLQLARELERPVVVHCRRAWGRLIALLAELRTLPRGFVVHSYSGARELIEPLAGAGGWFSFSGSITWRRNVRGREAARHAPRDRLLVETDAPDLMPAMPQTTATVEDAVNEPANLVRVLAVVAELRNTPAEVMAEQVWGNARRFAGCR